VLRATTTPITRTLDHAWVLPTIRDSAAVCWEAYLGRVKPASLGGAMLHDRIAGGASFGLDQNTFLFDSSANNAFGVPFDPITSLQSDPRF